MRINIVSVLGRVRYRAERGRCGRFGKSREDLRRLLRFNSTKSENLEPDRSLDDYLDDSAAPTKDSICYLTAESATAARNSPHLEGLREKGIEVLLLSDRIDEWVMQHLTEYHGKSFRDVSRGELDLSIAA